MDKIIIKEARFLCNLGVSEKERKEKQDIVVDVELFLDIKKASKTDNIGYTINYSEVYDLIRNIIGKKEYKLIETIAEEISMEILKYFDVNKVVVKIQKPNALADKNVKYVTVEIVREKNG